MDKSPLHYLGFVFVGFAELTDSEFSDEEHAKVVELVSGCDVPEDISQEDLALTLADIMMWYEGIDDREVREKEFFKTVDYLNNQDWFDESKKHKFMTCLAELMKADGKEKDSEKKWINKIASLWNINFKV